MAKKRVAWLSVGSNLLLTAGKIVAGLLTGSVSILSEAAHSAVDLLASMIATFSVHVSDRAPDQDHPYGHEKVENVSGVIEGLLIFVAAVWIIMEAVDKLRHGIVLENLGPGVLVMAVSAGMNLFVATMLKRSAVAHRSVALEADAAHLYTDVITSAGVMAGLTAITLAKRFLGKDLAWLDPVIAIGVAMLILRAAFEITKKSFQPLMDVAASAEELAAIESALVEFGERGVDFHKLRTRRAGPSLHVDLHMGCRPGVTLEQGHGISHEFMARLQQVLPGVRALVHVEPSKEFHLLGPEDERVARMLAEFTSDDRVCEVRELRVTSYHGRLRVEAELILDDKVTLAESQVVSRSLHDKIAGVSTEVEEIDLRLHPTEGWRDAIHDDDRARIRELVGEHDSAFAGVHQLRVSSRAGRHRVDIRLAVPRMLPVADAHAIGTHLENDIKALFNGDAIVDLHLEPCQLACDVCRAICPEKK